MKKIKILVIGCGNMGYSHALAYHKIPEFEIAGVVSRGPESRKRLSDALGGAEQFDNFHKALIKTEPDAVSINTYPDTHADYTLKALDAGCHVFVEKPIAETIKDAEAIARKVKTSGKKLVVGYILRHHPSWKKFIEIARTLGKPLVMRMNLNQQSCGKNWETHKQLMNSLSPIVDCGVHYVDIMSLMTRANPVRVNAIGARLSEELQNGMYNYGQLQVRFDDGSVGWYEAGWGPMMSDTAHFVKDVIGPNGSVTIVCPDQESSSDDIDSHTTTNKLKIHFAELDGNNNFVKPDEIIDMAGEPDHYELCKLEQEFFLKAITDDLDVSQHIRDAINSLKIVLAADKSVKTGKNVLL